MARKQRFFEPKPTLSKVEDEKVLHTDAFQKKGVEAVTGLTNALEGKGKTILYVIGAVAAVAIIAVIVSSWKGRGDATAQAALGKAIETATAQIDANAVAGTPGKTFKSEKDRAQAAVAEFEAVAAKFGGSVGEKAKYFAATNKLVIDRSGAMSDLEALSKGSGEIAGLSKFALAQARSGDGKSDEALALYREIAESKDSVVAKDTVNFEIAKILEKQGKKDEAVEVYFQIAKAASELKDADGNPAPLSQSARDAKDKVKALNPEKAKEIPEPAPASPLGL